MSTNTNTTIAVIQTGGKQYKVKEGDTLKVEKLEGDEGSAISFDNVLLIADSKSGASTVGTPIVKGAKVDAKIVNQGRDKKIKVVKYKPKTRNTSVTGHRQRFTQLTITKITSK